MIRNFQNVKESPVDVGYSLSLALRKICDNAQTTITYIAMQNVGEKSTLWGEYIRFVMAHDEYKRIAAKKRAGMREIVNAIRFATLEFCQQADKFRDDKMELIFLKSFDVFKVSDWENYSYYLWVEMEGV